MAQIEDIDAISRYITSQPIRTDTARQLKDDWIRWRDGLSFWDRNFDGSTYDLARNKKLAFDRANAVTAQQKQAVETVAKTGLSTEQMQGKEDRRTSTGEYAIQPKPIIPTEYKVAIAVVGAGAVLLFAHALPGALLSRSAKPKRG